jgi:hypothetical protein
MSRRSFMITKGLAPSSSGVKVFAIMGAPLSGAAAALGLVTVAWPLAWAPPWAYATASAGALAVLTGAFVHWRRGPVLAVTAAVAACAFSRAGIAVLTAEGLFILGYLLAADAPAGLRRPGSWLRQQVPGGVAGLIASGAVLAALALNHVSSAWLTAAGLAAAAVAYLIALPSKGTAARAAQQAAAQQAAAQQAASLPAAAPASSRDSDLDAQ